MLEELTEIIDRVQRGQEKTLLPVELLKPNPWNPNEMGETAWQALGQSITNYGIHLVPLVVRAVGEKFQIIDGEHRYKWALEMGITQVSAIVVDVDDYNAKKLTQILNRTRGEDNPVQLKELLDSLLVDHDPIDVIEGMAIASEADLDRMLKDLEKKVMSDYDISGENERSTQEIDAESFEFDHKCPKCGFEFDD